MLMDGRAQPTGIRRRGEDATLLMVLNAYHDLVEFSLPETPGGSYWQLLIDTNLADDDELGTFATGEVYGATGRSLLLFALESDTALEDNRLRADRAG
jgi:glycogen operon protein